MFTREDGKPYGKKEIERAFAVYRSVAGLRRELTIHTIRHTFASWLVIAGTPIKTVQELLGHASLAMTLRYAHLAPVHLRGALDSLASMRDSNSIATNANVIID